MNSIGITMIQMQTRDYFFSFEFKNSIAGFTQSASLLVTGGSDEMFFSDLVFLYSNSFSATLFFFSNNIG